MGVVVKDGCPLLQYSSTLLLQLSLSLSPQGAAMFSMPIVRLLDEGRKLAETGRRVSVLWQHADTLVFLARGREYRSEFHINPSDETMHMIKGDMRLHYRTPEGKEEVALIQEGAVHYT